MATINIGSIKFKWQGAYNGATAYTVDDVVSYNGSSYICIANSTGNLPTDTSYFEQMSSKGDTGANGTDFGTILTTQGDLVYRDGSGIQRLGAGTAGQLLQTGGAGANPSWVSTSSGKILQVVTSFKRDTASTTSTSFTNTGLSVSITPSSASSKILILCSWVAGVSTTSYSTHWKLNGTTTNAIADAGGGGSSNTVSIGLAGTPSGRSGSIVFEDSPNSTSQQTYDLQFKSTHASATIYINRSGFEDINTGRSISVMTAMEIGA